jgi:chemotaxis protein histidine kinase CheA/ActR/RegA family two-component response regulator
MIDYKNNISFSTFYLKEFFNHIIEKSPEIISEKHQSVLKELSDYLLKEENIIEGLEKVAQFQGTNEIAIFLFDMIDRVEDYAPDMVYATLPDLADDFLNLYNLLTEELESIEDIDKVLALFHDKYGEVKEKEIEAEAPVSYDDELLSFDEFYRREFDNHLDENLNDLKKKKGKFSEIINLFTVFAKETNEKKLNNYDDEIISITKQINQILPDKIEKIPASEKISGLDEKIIQIIQNLKDFEKEKSKLFKEILKKGSIPKKKQKVVKKKAALKPEEVPEKPVSIDALLHEYFQSEVEDHINEINKRLDDARKEPANFTAVKEIIKQFKLLKEISMIHGYSGIEHLSAKLIDVFTDTLKNKNSFNEETYKILDSIFKELLNVEQFTTVNRDDKQVAAVGSFIESLKDTFGQPVIEKTKGKKVEEEAAVEDAAAVGAEALIEGGGGEVEEDIPFSDKKAIYSILQDLFGQIKKKVYNYHNDLKNADVKQNLFNLINQISNSTSIVQPALKEDFFKPLLQAYDIVIEQDENKFRQGLDIIEQIWDQFIELPGGPFDISVLKELFNSVLALPEQEEELYSLKDDQKIAGALSEIQDIRWQKMKGLLKNSLLENDSSAQDTLLKYFNNFLSDIKLLDYENYIEPVEYFIKTIKNERAIQFTDALAAELEKAYDLIIEKISVLGKNGKCDDIISAIDDLINEQITSGEEAVEPEPESEPIVDEDDDLEEIFISESRQQIDSAKEALSHLEKEIDNRAEFIRLENSIHSIRSSALLLNKQNVADLANIIERIAEILGRSSISVPQDLIPNLQTGVDKLDELIENQKGEAQEISGSLQQILDQIQIEEQKTPKITEEEIEREDQSVVSEKPLFAESEDFDKELLEIFQQEAENFISIIDNSNTKLLEDLNNAEALDKLEYAAHSLKSAAKMLGFREIGQITDSLEAVVEAVKNKEMDNSIDLQNTIAETLGVVKQLSAGEKVESSELARIINNLDTSQFKKIPQTQKPVEVKTEESTPEEDNIEKVKDYFIEEAADLISNIESDLIELEKIPESEILLANLLRNLHTLKGSSMMAKYEKIGELSHKLEDYFEIYKRQTSDVKQEMLNPAFTMIDLIYEIFDSIKAGKEEIAPQFTAKLAEIDNKLFLFQNYDIKAEKTQSIVHTDKEETTAIAKTVPDEDNIIKINTSYLDGLVNMATELIVNRTELTTYFENLKKLIATIEEEKKQIRNAENLIEDIIEDREYEKQKNGQADIADESSGVGFKEDGDIQNLSSSFKKLSNDINSITTELNKLSYGFEKNINRISNLSKVLHNDILKARMVPIEYLFDRFPRAVRDLARTQDKNIKLVIEGNETEMDRAIVEALSDPVLHLIRNAVDHGIESQKERADLNKNKTGKIILRARQDKSQVVIDIVDDGRGIDLNTIKERIIRNQLATEENVEQMSEAEVLDYIFYPEFSTRDEATEISGRGIGLDVAANQIQKLKGNIRIKTEKNAGTTFSIRVPLTLVVSQALIIRSYGQSIAIPIMAVQESVDIDKDNILVDDNKKYIQVRGKLLPFITISEILNFEKEQIGALDHEIALILHDAGVSIALGIKEITGRQEIVIKALGSHLQNVEYVAGGAILGNGEVALILDYAAIIRTIEFQFFGNVTDTYSIKKAHKKKEKTKPEEVKLQKEKKSKPTAKKSIPKKMIKNRKPRILIVDDSSSVRNFVGSVLEREGFETLKSSDGITAIDKIENEEVDLVITDLEMPKMHGFELITKIRDQKKFDNMPIVILTGRAGQDKHKKGKELGANAFIIKPFKESDLLNVLAEFIEIKEDK